MSTVIRAGRSRVWRALSDPAELVRWDPGIEAAVGSTQGYPTAGESVRWRYRLGPVPVILRGEPLEVLKGVRLRCLLTFGLFHLDETWTLGEENPGEGKTRLGLRLVAGNEVPLVGGSLDRFSVRRIATDRVGEALAGIRAFCEHE